MSPLNNMCSHYSQGYTAAKILLSLPHVNIPSCPQIKFEPMLLSFSRGTYGFHQKTGGSISKN